MAHFGLDGLRLVLQKAGLLNKTVPLWKRFAEATKIDEVRGILDLQLPTITDLSEVLGIADLGKVLAVRMDLNTHVDNHKKVVIAGLILRGVITGRIPNERIDTLIDGGNFNSAKALKYYVERFGMKGMYIMSYLFPKDIIDLLESDNFTVVRAPHKYDHAREREFYEFLRERMRDEKFGRNKFCLWHAKYGGAVAYPFGKGIAQEIKTPLDCTIACLGAGSILEGLQIPIQDVFEEKGLSLPAIFIAEHQLSPLFAKSITVQTVSGDVIPSHMADARKYRRVPELPHIVIGPHYDEINPLLSQASIARVKGVVQYSEVDWQATQAFLAERGISVGNSSAANISVAWRLASERHRVLTVIYEPWRSFYSPIKT